MGRGLFSHVLSCCVVFATLAQVQPTVASAVSVELAATTVFRLKSATPVVEQWHCETTARGVVCGFDGEAVCDVAERRVAEMESCGR